MAELNSAVDERPDVKGLKLIASGDRFEIWEDGAKRLATVQAKAGPLYGRGQMVVIEVQSPRTKMGWKLMEYVANSLQKQTMLMPFVLKSTSMMKVVEHLYRTGSRSSDALRNYAKTLNAFSDYTHKSPDDLVSIGFTKEGAVDQIGVHKLTKLADEYLGELEASDLATGSMAVKQAHIKTFFRVNGIPLEPLRKYSLRVRYRARSPKPDEVQHVIELAEMREKAMTLMLATGGFRIGTLMQLRYRHVKDDLEANRIPLHIHVEAEITKGKYADFDTFLNEEAVHYLKL